MSTESNEKKYALDIRDLFVEFRTDDGLVKAVNGASIRVEKGKTIGLVGETGAGKTTTALASLRLVPNPPGVVTGGKIYLEGEDLSAYTEKQMYRIRGNIISMIFQDPMTSLNPVFTVGEQIAEVIALHEDCTKQEARQKAGEMLEKVGIPAARADDYPHQFSGGMKQRVVIAIALACNPDLLLADEPTTALDVTIQAQVLDLIADLRKKYNTAMLLITHDLGVVAQVCDEVAVIYAGNIIEYGTKEQIFDHPTHPYTIGLFGAIPDMNEDEIWLHPIEGLPPDPTNLPVGCAFAPRCKHACEACSKGPIEMQTTADGHVCRCCRMAEIAKEG